MDYYELLGLGHLAMVASQDLIRKACECGAQADEADQIPKSGRANND